MQQAEGALHAESADVAAREARMREGMEQHLQRHIAMVPG